MVDGTFDFFLVPHSVTQGAVKPTHFYVASNTSKISKDAILNFTYALCYNYYNWADSIKIPAPCMLADKIPAKLEDAWDCAKRAREYLNAKETDIDARYFAHAARAEDPESGVSMVGGNRESTRLDGRGTAMGLACGM